MTIKIRIAAVEDVNEITALNSELGYSASTQEINERLRAMLLSENYCAFVAERDNDVVGWLVVEKRLSLESGYKAEITGLVVSQHARRLGIAKQLVDAAIQWAISKKLSRIIVHSNVNRSESHNFYLNQNFVYTKTSHNYEKEVF